MAKRRTHEEFVDLIYNKTNGEHEVIGKYVNSSTKVKIKHNICNYEWDVLPSNFLKKASCPNCSGKIKKTTESFRKEIYTKVHDEYTVLGEYINTNEKILMKHNVCGYEWGAIPYVFLGGSRCPECAIEINAKKLRKTHEKFVQQVYDLVQDEYEVRSEYKGSHTNIDLFHKTCGRIWTTQPNNFLYNNTRCFYCAGKESKTHEKFVEEVNEKYGNDYTVLGKYTTTFSKIKIRHNICGTINEPTPANFLKGHGCGVCSGNVQWTHKQFVNKVEELEGNNYTVLTEYINNQTKVKVKHNICNREYYVAPNHFLNGQRCRECRFKEQVERQSKTHEEFVQAVYELEGDNYTVIGKYIKLKTKVRMRHNECGHEYDVSPSHFLYGDTRCVRCRISKGEKAIASWLDLNYIKYEMQYKFNDCRNQKRLPFDFAVFNEDNSLILIEYQGIQHHKTVDFYGGEKSLRYTQKNDQIKKEYCKNNKITLLEINYWDFDKIDQILNDQLLPLNLMKQENPAPLDKLEQKQLEFSF